MSSYESTKQSAGHKAEETKNVGQKKAGEAQQATKVRDQPFPTLFFFFHVAARANGPDDERHAC